MKLHDFQKQKALSTLSTFGIGGCAAYFIEVRSYADMQDAIRTCRENALPYHIVGKGSNSLFSDQGFSGVIILNKIEFIKEIDPGLFYAGGGSSFSLLGSQTARQGRSGLEFAAGIPASVGGAVYMNAGANGSDTAQTLVSVDFIDAEGTLKTLLKDQLYFSYRRSSFQQLQGAIVGATFQLNPSATARETQLSIIRYRQATQPYGQKSAGCIFKNPDCGHAGALIEACGLKGKSIGGAQVSTMHANFIINASNASAKDVLELIEHVRDVVALKQGVILESEVQIITDSSMVSL